MEVRNDGPVHGRSQGGLAGPNDHERAEGDYVHVVVRQHGYVKNLGCLAGPPFHARLKGDAILLELLELDGHGDEHGRS